MNIFITISNSYEYGWGVKRKSLVIVCCLNLLYYKRKESIFLFSLSLLSLFFSSCSSDHLSSNMKIKAGKKSEPVSMKKLASKIFFLDISFVATLHPYCFSNHTVGKYCCCSVCRQRFSSAKDPCSRAMGLIRSSASPCIYHESIARFTIIFINQYR